VYCEAQIEAGKQEAVEELIPEISAHVGRVEKYFKLSVAEDGAGMSEEEAEMSKIGYDFVLGQMLRIALLLDYSDEVGRRNTFTSLRGFQIGCDLACEVD